MKNNILKLGNFSSILSRDVVKNILEPEVQAINFDIIYLDLNGIEFISRSAADELLKMIERFEYSDNKKKIIFKNLNSGVAVMIRTVAANKAYHVDKNEEIFKPKRVNIKDLVKI